MTNKRGGSLPVEILIYGPVRPTRGGIAKHTENLALAISKTNVCKVFSDAKNFPAKLYPGRTQVSGETSILVGSQVKIYRKPFFRLLVDFFLQISKHQNNLTVIPWWSVAQTPKVIFVLLFLKLLNRKFVFFCHNVLPHESTPMSTRVAKFILSLSENFMVQSQTEERVLKSLVGNEINVSLVGHPKFSLQSRNPRKRVKKDSFEILFAGFMRQYKGVDLLCNAIMELEEPGNLRFTFIGECWDTSIEKLLNEVASSSSPTVRVNLEYQSEEQLAESIMECDFLILPYRGNTGSGILSLAKEFGKPVIVSDLESFKSEVRPGIDGLFFETGNVQSLTSLLASLGQHQKFDFNPWSNSGTSETWETLALKTISFYKS